MRVHLTLAERRNRRGQIRRASLVDPVDSAFNHLYLARQDDALITLCGLDFNSFENLLAIFSPLFLRYTPHVDSSSNIRPVRVVGRGRPRLITPTFGLGLVLAWTRTRGSLMNLQLIFGLTSSKISIWLRFSRRILLLVLSQMKEAAVEMPSVEEARSLATFIESKYPALEGVWGAMDGLKVMVETSGDPIEQSYYFNGWLQGHYLSNLLLFSCDGKIRAAYLNCPGTYHDSAMAHRGEVYKKIEGLYTSSDGRAKVVVDSAFNLEQCPYLIKSYQNNYNGDFRQIPVINQEATSVRQLAEWGMRGFQSSFPRLKDKLRITNHTERQMILSLCLKLWNYRASVVGQNQIRSSFMPHLNRIANDVILI